MNIVDSPTIPQLARRIRVPQPDGTVKLGIPRRTLFRRLMAMHGRDRAEKGPKFIPWLYKYAQGPWRVNISRLRREHPEMAGVATNEELDRRVTRMERQIEVVDESQRALVKTVREFVGAR
jgi:hypothetical protein